MEGKECKNNLYGIRKPFQGLKLYTLFFLQIVCVFSDPILSKYIYFLIFIANIIRHRKNQEDKGRPRKTQEVLGRNWTEPILSARVVFKKQH